MPFAAKPKYSVRNTTYFWSTPPFTLIVRSAGSAVLFFSSVGLRLLVSVFLWSVLNFQWGVLIWLQGQQNNDVLFIICLSITLLWKKFNLSSPLHLMQYHSRIAFAIFSVMLMQWPWNHSLQLSQPLSAENAKVENNVWALLYPYTVMRWLMQQLWCGEPTSWSSWCLVSGRYSKVVHSHPPCYCSQALVLGRRQTFHCPEKRIICHKQH